MNTQVNSEVPAAAVFGTPTVLVAETAPVALTQVAAAVAGKPAATPTPLLDDFLDEPDAQPVPTEAVKTASASEDESASDSEIIEDLEGPADGLEELDAGSDLVGLTDLEDAVEDEQSMVVVDVFKKKCTDCTHLIPWGTKTHKRCHFSNGNDLCPAQSVRVRRYIPVDQIVTSFMAAEAQGDTDRLVRLYESLKTKAADVQEEIHAALKAAREKKALKAIEA